MFVFRSTYDEAVKMCKYAQVGWGRANNNRQTEMLAHEKTKTELNVMRQTADNRQDIIIKLQAENMALRAKIPKKHTEPYQDPLGRWRDPNNHGYCMKRPDPLVEADKLRKAGGM